MRTNERAQKATPLAGDQRGQVENNDLDQLSENPGGLSSEVSVFENAWKPKPCQKLTLHQVLENVKSDKYKAQIERLRSFLKTDPGRYDKEKPSLPGLTFPGTFYHRNTKPENLIQATGFIVADLDHMTDVEGTFDLVCRDENVWFAFRSPSGDGIKAGLRAHFIESDSDIKRFYQAIECYFKETYALDIDPACKDVSRLTFVSHDPNLFINPDPCFFDVEAWVKEPDTRPRPTWFNPPSATGAGKEKYARKVLESACDAIRTSERGNMHHTRLRMSRLAGGYIHYIDENEVYNALEAAVMESGTTDPKKALKTIRDGLECGKQAPIEIPDIDRGDHGEASEIKPAGSNKFYHFTELGNAERFADQHGGYVRYVAPWKKWIVYNGRRWKVGADDQIRRYAHQTVKGLYALAAETDDSDMASKIAKWAATSSKSASISAMLKEASALLAIEPQQLDANPWLFNCWNCTIDLQSGDVRQHRRDNFITKITAVSFDPEATAPLFKQTLYTCLNGSQELIDYVQRFAGYCMTGATREQCLNIWHGNGANGKTTIIETISEALGEYAQTTRPETLMVKRTDSIPSDLAKLKGARFVTAAEAEDGHRLAESAVKQMTGGEKIQARALYQDWFEYTPEFKILLCTNHKPLIRGGEHAIWRRIRLVPFEVTIPEAERDKNLPENLRAELPGILTWITTGAALWMTHGLGKPDAVARATESYQSEQNIIGQFIESCCTVKPGAMAEAKQLFMAFDEWRQAEGHRKITQTKFGRMLAQLGFEKERSAGSGRLNYQGIGLNS